MTIMMTITMTIMIVNNNITNSNNNDIMRITTTLTMTITLPRTKNVTTTKRPSNHTQQSFGSLTTIINTTTMTMTTTVIWGHVTAMIWVINSNNKTTIMTMTLKTTLIKTTSS